MISQPEQAAKISWRGYHLSQGLRNGESQVRALWAEGMAFANSLRREQTWIALGPARGPGWLEWGEPGEHGWGGIGGTVKRQVAMGTDLLCVLCERKLE